MPTYVIPSNPNANAQIAQGIAQLGMALAGGNPEEQAKARLIRDQMMTGAAEREKLALETQILRGKKGVLDSVGEESVPTIKDAEGRTVVDPNYLGKALSNQIILTDGAADPSRWQGAVNSSVEDELARKRALEDDQRKFEQTLALERDKPIVGSPDQKILNRDPVTGYPIQEGQTPNGYLDNSGNVVASPTAVPSTDRGANGDGFPNRDLRAIPEDALPSDPSAPQLGLLPGDTSVKSSKLGSALSAGPVEIPKKKSGFNYSNTISGQKDLKGEQDAILKLDSLADQFSTARAKSSKTSDPMLAMPFGLGKAYDTATQVVGTEGGTLRRQRNTLVKDSWLKASADLKGSVTENENAMLRADIPNEGAAQNVWDTWTEAAEWATRMESAWRTQRVEAIQNGEQPMNPTEFRNAYIQQNTPPEFFKTASSNFTRPGKTAGSGNSGSSLGSALGGAPTPSPTPAPQTDQAVHISGDDDYNKLPSGALFIGPDGQTRRKP